jgi:hypothetical protein
MFKTISALALGAVLMFGGAARADEVVIRTGGHYETRLVTVTEPGHFENRERRVWVPETVTYERRERRVRCLTVDACGVTIATTRVVCETVPVTHPGYWTTTCERVWVEGCTHTVERQVWVAECRRVIVERPCRTFVFRAERHCR